LIFRSFHRQWNPRKKRLMQAEHVSAAWDRLEATGWFLAKSH
jgi:hypothetical protein